MLKGKQVVVYKSGKTAPGIGGVLGHTASIAGDPARVMAIEVHVLGNACAAAGEAFHADVRDDEAAHVLVVTSWNEDAPRSRRAAVAQMFRDLRDAERRAIWIGVDKL